MLDFRLAWFIYIVEGVLVLISCRLPSLRDIQKIVGVKHVPQFMSHRLPRAERPAGCPTDGTGVRACRLSDDCTRENLLTR